MLGHQTDWAPSCDQLGETTDGAGALHARHGDDAASNGVWVVLATSNDVVVVTTTSGAADDFEFARPLKTTTRSTADLACCDEAFGEVASEEGARRSQSRWPSRSSPATSTLTSEPSPTDWDEEGADPSGITGRIDF